MAVIEERAADEVATRLGFVGAAAAGLNSNSILNRAERFSRAVDHVTGQSGNAFGVVIESMLSAVEALVNGRRTLLFGTNNYLGLNFNPVCRAAAMEAIERFGTGSTASRVAGGTCRLHVELECELTKFYERRHAIVFSTGFMANLGVISALVRRGDSVFLDAHCHASIIDAAKLSGADVQLFRHNDSDDLDCLFRATELPGSRVLVVIEGLYSVTGDLAKLADLMSVAKRHHAVTIVDEAHALGVYGSHGRGVSEHSGMEDLVDIIVGTFSKSVGVVGGFSVTNLEQLRGLWARARPYIYTASLPPAVVATARESLRLIRNDASMRERLWRNAEHLRSGLAAAGIEMSGCGPIGRIVSSARSGIAIWSALLARGIYVNLLVPPSTPYDEVALRLSVSAAHTPENIEEAVAGLTSVIAAEQFDQCS